MKLYKIHKKIKSEAERQKIQKKVLQFGKKTAHTVFPGNLLIKYEAIPGAAHRHDIIKQSQLAYQLEKVLQKYKEAGCP
ncbi:MAG: hypothetical protein HFG18_08200 [Oscillospiraceae bacterium]|nr:hypothetical protein [Oscillospiraceae bacterium]